MYQPKRTCGHVLLFSKMKQENCEVCNAAPFKYTCPRCEVQTCSLNCVSTHKNELKCNGQREKTGYVPISKFDNLTLLSDYRFLEDINRTVETCRRNPQKKYTRYQQPLPTHLYRLKSAAERRKTHLQFLPQHFTRHQSNNSILKYNTQTIHWKLDLIFPQGEMIKISELVDENQKLGKVMDKFLDPVQCPDIYKKYLKFYHATGVSDVEVLIKAERRIETNPVFQLDLSETVKENLKNRTIIENPILYIIKKAYIQEYTVLDDDNLEIPSEALKGVKSGYFGDFTPINYFTTQEEKKAPSKGEVAMQSILASARELRGNSQATKEEAESSESDEEVAKPYKEISIPSYDNLCKS